MKRNGYFLFLILASCILCAEDAAIGSRLLGTWKADYEATLKETGNLGVIQEDPNAKMLLGMFKDYSLQFSAKEVVVETTVFEKIRETKDYTIISESDYDIVIECVVGENRERNEFHFVKDDLIYMKLKVDTDSLNVILRKIQ